MRNPMQLFGRWQVQLILLLSLCCPASVFAQDADTTANSTEVASDATPAEIPAVTEPEFNTLVKALTQGSLPKRAQTAKKLGKLDDPRVAGVIAALQQGNLYAEKSSDPVVAIVDTSGNYVNVISGEKIAADATESLKRVPINNTMRTQLRTILAALNLNDKNATVRLDAVNRMIADGVDEDIITLLQERQKTEPDDDVRAAITAAVALMNLQSSEQQVRLDAIQILRGSLQQEVRTALLEIATNDADEKVKQQAQFALDSIEDRIAAFRLTENIFFGLSLGSVLLLSAIGLAITFGVMGVINMAHGELMMIGAYVTWVVQQLFPNHSAYS